ncbi:MAG: hypothetical protein K2X35_07485 [Bryobacteraceae bacterium]|nr:hypothetical protein [Bryobacteraceae bacterium]
MGAKRYTVEEAGPRINRFLNAIYQLSGLDLEHSISPGDGVHADFENPDIMVRFSGADSDILLANKAELLLALEQLTMELLRMSSEEHSRICFDSNDYRMLRIEEIRLSALAAAERVRKTGMPFHFSPMNSRERRIVHLALRNETEVRSESVGMGHERQVVIVPKDMKTLPPPKPAPKPPREREGGRDSGRDRGPRRDGGRDRGRDRRR